jgi:hypothetical protein
MGDVIAEPTANPSEGFLLWTKASPLDANARIWAIRFMGDPVVTATSTTVTHKIPIEINGVTYYVFATTTQ